MLNFICQALVCAFPLVLPWSQSLQMHWQVWPQFAGWLVHVKVATSQWLHWKDLCPDEALPEACDSVLVPQGWQVEPPVKPASGNGARSDLYFIVLIHSLVKIHSCQSNFEEVEVDWVLPACWSEENQASLTIVMTFSFWNDFRLARNCKNCTKNSYLLLPRCIKY